MAPWSRCVNTESTFTAMAPETDPVDFVGREPDERLLGEDMKALPESVGRPHELPQSPRHDEIVRIGAALTGATLMGGIALSLFGAVDAIATGFELLSVAALVLGILLVTTHWGWVHVAEISARRMDARNNRQLVDGRQEWLAGIEPYPRWEVSTSTRADGSILITTERYRPLACGPQTFTFARELETSETHSGEEPAATVTDRAENLRRQAALDTARARERYELARDAYENALLEHGDEQQRIAATRAASEALSERINANLREPPLTE